MGCCAASPRQQPDEKEESLAQTQSKKLEQTSDPATDDTPPRTQQADAKKEDPPNVPQESGGASNPLTAGGRKSDESKRLSIPSNAKAELGSPSGSAQAVGANTTATTPVHTATSPNGKVAQAPVPEEQAESPADKPDNTTPREEVLDKDKDVDKKAQEGTPLKDAANHSSKVDLSAGGGHASSSNLANSRNTEEPREERVFDERKLRLRKWFDGIPPNPVPINTNAQQPEHLSLTAENIEKNRYYLQKLARAQFEESLGITGHSFRARTPAHTSSFRGGDMGASLAAVPSGRIDTRAEGPASDNRFMQAGQSTNNISTNGGL